VQDDVRRISDAGKTLLEIVNNILDLSKVESGQFTIRDDLYETRRLIDELSGSVITRLKNKPVNFLRGMCRRYAGLLCTATPCLLSRY
jgi:K+-sensing histidine kinase KdpD